MMGIYPPQRQKTRPKPNIACQKKTVYTVNPSWDCFNNSGTDVFPMQLQQLYFVVHVLTIMSHRTTQWKHVVISEEKMNEMNEMSDCSKDWQRLWGSTKQVSHRITTLTPCLQCCVDEHTHSHSLSLRSDLFTTSLNYSTHTHTHLPDVEIKRIPAGVVCEPFWKI